MNKYEWNDIVVIKFRNKDRFGIVESKRKNHYNPNADGCMEWSYHILLPDGKKSKIRFESQIVKKVKSFGRYEDAKDYFKNHFQKDNEMFWDDKTYHL